MKDSEKINKVSRCVIMAGGTGGHVFPALTVAEALKKAGVQVCWVGTVSGIEATLVEQYDFEWMLVPVTGLRGKKKRFLLFNFWKFFHTFITLFFYIRKKNPDFVIGVGGYVSGPGGLVSWLLRKPLIIHEQNAIPGWTNGILFRGATRVLESFPSTFKPHEKVVCTGNVIRPELFQLPPPKVRFAGRNRSLRILVLGGSQGAQFLNESLPLVFKKLQNDLAPFNMEVWHQTGSLTHEATTLLYKEAPFSVTVTPFIHDMKKAYEWADLVVCRSGATTLAELAAVGLGSVLIPYPHAVDDHQTKNAAYFETHGAAVLVPQKEKEAFIQTLFEALHSLCQHRSVLLEMAEAAHSLAKPQAVEEVLQQCILASKKTHSLLPSGVMHDSD